VQVQEYVEEKQASSGRHRGSRDRREYDWENFYVILVLPPFLIIRHFKNFGESKHLKFDQNYRENYKNL
jgi:hypothetical protein